MNARDRLYLSVEGVSDRLRNPQPREDGRGGTVEVPLAVVTHGVIAENTAGGGPGTYDVDTGYIDELVQNFARKPGPATIYWSHDPKPRRSKSGEMPLPAAGRILEVWREGEELWGRLDLGPRAWNAVVEERGFFAFSIEASLDLTTATGDIDGWTLTGGIFTNNPALNVNFSTAQRGDGDFPRADDSIALRGGGRKEEGNMAPTATLETLQADVTRLTAETKQKDDRAKALEAENAELKKKLDAAPAADKVVALEHRMTALEESNKSLKLENDSLKKQTLARDVAQIVDTAIRAGAPPAFFGEWQKDPIAFLETRFGGKVEALKASVDALPKQPFGRTNVQTGVPATDGGAENPKEQLRLEAEKLAEEKNLSFSAALDQIRKTKPDVWKRGTEEYHTRNYPAASGE